MPELVTGALYGATVEGARDFNHVCEIEGKEDVATISSVTVWTDKATLGDCEEELIVDVAFEYTVGGKLRQAGPYGRGADEGAESSTFGLPGEIGVSRVAHTTDA